MSGGMPYYLEKGPTLAVLEDFANADTARLKTALGALRSGASLPDIGVLDSTTLDGGPLPESWRRIAHVKIDWFGYRLADGSLPGDVTLLSQADAAGLQPQPAFDSATNPQTGYWLNYYGDVEAILRKTLIEAVEVALGLDHGEAVSASTRHWPITFFWKCGQNWFEGWVSWHRSGGQGTIGQVAVVFCTPTVDIRRLPPGEAHPVWPSPIDPAPRPGDGYAKDPATHGGGNGMLVVSHAQHVDLIVASTASPTSQANVLFPTVLWRGAQGSQTIVVKPGESRGGIKADGRKYQVTP